MKKPIVLGCLFLAGLALTPASAAIISETHDFDSLNLSIPDGNPSGLANVQSFGTNVATISDLEVSLRIAATPSLAYNGDLYVYLTHGSGITILLNRVGRMISETFGYSDNGFDITLDDEAANGDVHVYRDVSTPAPGQPLTGAWAPDARATDPNLVLNTDPRTSFLSAFNTLNPAGDWTLFVADLSTGAEHRLEKWSLTITGEAVPEPSAVGLLAASTLLLAHRRRPAHPR